MNDIRKPISRPLPQQVKHKPSFYATARLKIVRSASTLYRKTVVVLQKKSGRMILLGALLAVGVIFIGARFVPGVKEFIAPDPKATPLLKQTQGVLTKQDPPFSTKTPNGESYEGKWTRVSPSERNPVYAFNGAIEGVNVIVSQQPLPKELRNDTVASTQALAAGYSATQKLEVPGAAAFVGTSAKGPQSVIMTKDNLLILIKSSERIPNQSWEAFLTTLR